MDTFRTGGSRSQRLLSTEEDFVLLSEKRKNKRALRESRIDNDEEESFGDYQAPSNTNLIIRSGNRAAMSKSVSNTDSGIWDNPNGGAFKMFDSRRDSEQSELRIISSQMPNNRDRNHTSNASNITNLTNNNNTFLMNNNNNIRFSQHAKISNESVSEMTPIKHKSSANSNRANAGTIGGHGTIGTIGTDYIIAINNGGNNNDSITNLNNGANGKSSLLSSKDTYYNMDHLNSNASDITLQEQQNNNRNNNNNKNNNNNNSKNNRFPKRSQTCEAERLEQSQSSRDNSSKNAKLRSMSHNQYTNNNSNAINRFANDLIIGGKLNDTLDTLGNKSQGTITSGYDDVEKIFLSSNFPCWLWLCCPILCPIAIIYICWVSFVNPRCFMSFTIMFHLALDWFDEITDVLFVLWINDHSNDIRDNNEIFYLFAGGIVLNHCCNFVYCIIIRNLWRFDEEYLRQFPHLEHEIKV